MGAEARREVLTTAIEAVVQDRNASYGEPEDSFATIADLWAWWLTGRGQSVSVTSHDVAMMLALLKVARARQNPTHIDSYVDLAGYAACAVDVMGTAVETGHLAETVTPPPGPRVEPGLFRPQ